MLTVLFPIFAWSIRIRPPFPIPKDPHVAKITEIRDAALADQALVVADKDIVSKANVALASAESSAAVSTPAFGAVIVKKGGSILDVTMTPAVIWTAPPDGLTFSSYVPALVTDEDV